MLKENTLINHQQHIEQETAIRSPCISNCCLDDKDICLGCFRHIDEITGWHSADNNRRKEIMWNTVNRRVK